ncbi:MAG: hypothetical protein ACI9FR_002868 [Cryomorphaceae bacterium]|jgi:hypothetical protein
MAVMLQTQGVTIMILRRVIKHFRNQEWTAIGIDFMIVVFGLLVATQVTNWNSTRQDHARGEIYSKRLKSDLHLELEYTKALLAYHKVTLEAGRVAYVGLKGNSDFDDETILVNAYRATQHTWYERRRASFDEIVASGALGLISDQGIREAAIGIYNTPLFDMLIQEGQNSKYRELFRMVIEPDLQDALNRNCGDRELPTRRAALVLLTLDYDCTLNTSPKELAAAVKALRSDPDITQALRLRHAQTAGRISEIPSIIESYGLQALFLEEGAP